MNKTPPTQEERKCSCCKREIKECNECHENFEKDDIIICNDAEEHFCNTECYMNYYCDEIQECPVE